MVCPTPPPCPPPCPPKAEESMVRLQTRPAVALYKRAPPLRFTNTPRRRAPHTPGRAGADAADPCALYKRVLHKCVLYKRASRGPRWRSGRARWSRPAVPSSPTSRPRATRRARPAPGAARSAPRPAPLRPRAVALWRLFLGAVPSLGAVLPPYVPHAGVPCGARGLRLVTSRQVSKALTAQEVPPGSGPV